MRRIIPVVLTLAIPLACDDSPTAIDDGPPPETLISSFAVLSAGPDGTYPCPAGGELVRQTDVTAVTQGNVLTATWSATIEHRSCAIRIDELVLTGDGTMAMNGVERYDLGQNSLGNLIESTMHQTGTMRWRTSDGYDRTCEMDLTITRHPETNARRMTGVLCGHSIDVEITLP